MNRIAEFTKTTLVGGVLIILPVYLAVLLLAKAFSGLMALISPLTAALPPEMAFREAIAIAVVVAACFFAGLVVRTGPGLRAKNSIERAMLEKIPGYTLLRGLTGRVAGRGDDTVSFAAALVEIEEALVPAFVVEELADGRYTVFVPSVPTPAAGAVYIMDRARVHLVDVPFTQAVTVITKWGSGAGALVAAMHPD